MASVFAAPSTGPQAPAGQSVPRQAVPGQAVHRLAVHRLVLTDFRCYGHAVLEPGADVVVLTGPNGAGKTNLLEAVSLLAPGRGLRGAPFSQLARRAGTGGWGVAASVLAGPDLSVEIGTGQTPASPDASARGRLCRLNHKPVAGSSVLGKFVRIAWLTPALDRLFAEPAAARRRFLDRIVLGVDPDHGIRVRDYERAMATRNRLLKDGADGRWLDAVESAMAECGVAVADARRHCVARLQALLVSPHPHGSPGAAFPGVRLALKEEVGNQPVDGAADEPEEAFRAVLRDRRALDARAGRTLAGPHRTDLLVFHSGGDAAPRDMPAGLCSTGEQKALVISLVLAHARLLAAGGAAPLVLLDEVAAHLDEGRRQTLFQAAAALGGQVWITGCERSLFASLEGSARIFTIREGRILPPDGV